MAENKDIGKRRRNSDLVGYLGFDFGTSTTAVAFAKGFKDAVPLSPANVHCITGWPNAAKPDWEPLSQTPYLPSEFIYPSTLENMHRPKDLEVLLEDDVLEDRGNRSTNLATNKNERFLCGWDAREHKYSLHCDSEANAVSLLKLRLLNSPDTVDITYNLECVIRRLKDRGILPNTVEKEFERFANEQMLNDFFFPVFKQTKDYLELECSQWYTEEIPFHITMTWPPMCSDESREVLEKACRNVESVVRISDRPSFEFAAEPEAARHFVVAGKNKVIPVGASFTVLDCGGGTVDAHTYTNHGEGERSAGIQKGGRCCGARFVTLAAKRLLEKELSHRGREKIDNFLRAGESSIEAMIDDAVRHFETNIQTCFTGVQSWSPKVFGISTQNPIIFTGTEVSACFRRSVNGAVNVMTDQLNHAQKVGLMVKKVVLVGGFGQSPMLRKRLLYELNKRKTELGEEVELVVLDPQDRNSANPVACGAVLRSSKLHVEKQLRAMEGVGDDPDSKERIARYSYGILRREGFQPWTYKGHSLFPKRYLKKFRSSTTGEVELQTILWLKQKGEVMQPGVFAEVECEHVFDASRPKLICLEKFYSSEKRMESHYDEDSEDNKKHARFVSHFEVDMTFLKDEGLKLRSEGRPKPVYVVKFTLRIFYDGDKLDFEIEYDIDGRTVVMHDLPKTQFKFGLAAHFYEREIHPEPTDSGGEGSIPNGIRKTTKMRRTGGRTPLGKRICCEMS